MPTRSGCIHCDPNRNYSFVLGKVCLMHGLRICFIASTYISQEVDEESLDNASACLTGPLDDNDDHVGSSAADINSIAEERCGTQHNTNSSNGRTFTPVLLFFASLGSQRSIR